MGLHQCPSEKQSQTKSGRSQRPFLTSQTRPRRRHTRDFDRQHLPGPAETDSPAEGIGFEISVPRRDTVRSQALRRSPATPGYHSAHFPSLHPRYPRGPRRTTAKWRRHANQHHLKVWAEGLPLLGSLGARPVLRHHIQSAFVKVEQGLLFVVLLFVHSSDLDDLAHDLWLEAAAFVFGVDFLDIFAERALLVLEPLNALNKQFELCARDAPDIRAVARRLRSGGVWIADLT